VAAELAPYDSLGLGVPGLITRDGSILASPNLTDTNDFRVGPLLSERLGCQVWVENDATCATVAEWMVGAAQGATDFVMVTLGTGIGGGVVAGGQVVRGVHGFGGEIGHMVLDPDGVRCPCGRRGCWERYASGSGLGWLGREALAQAPMPRVVELAGGDPAQVRGEHVQAAAAEGDTSALAVVDTFCRWVALGLANLTNLLDPALFVIGGGLASAPEVFLPAIRSHLDHMLYSGTTVRPQPSIVFASLGPHAGAVGAAMLPQVH
jgi:glucokinase